MFRVTHPHTVSHHSLINSVSTTPWLKCADKKPYRRFMSYVLFFFSVTFDSNSFLKPTCANISLELLLKITITRYLFKWPSAAFCVVCMIGHILLFVQSWRCILVVRVVTEASTLLSAGHGFKRDLVLHFHISHGLLCALPPYLCHSYGRTSPAIHVLTSCLSLMMSCLSADKSLVSAWVEKQTVAE